MSRLPSRVASAPWNSRVRSATTQRCKPISCLAIACCRPIRASVSPAACRNRPGCCPRSFRLQPWRACSASQTHEAHVLSDTTVRSLVRTQRQIIRLAEQGDVTALLQRDDLATIALQLVPHNRPRRRAGWPAALHVAVDTALAAEQVRPPDGISWADWERGKRGTPCRCDLHDGGPPPRGGQNWTRSRSSSRSTRCSRESRSHTGSLNCARRGWLQRRAIAS